MIFAKIICDSITEQGNRLTTFVAVLPKFINAELCTHRALSRNMGSSRARPLSKTITSVRENVVQPVSWGLNQAGMSASKELDPQTSQECFDEWKKASQDAITHAENLAGKNVHKQIANRVLEPYIYTEAIISATEWGNFFNLRCHPDAQPEFQELAYCMLQAYVDSIPVVKRYGEWHIPFGDKYLEHGISEKERVKIGVARCARVSYLNFEGDIDHQKDYQLHDDLLKSGHMSPFEHVAMAANGYGYDQFYGNFCGWEQYRRTIPNENRKKFDPVSLLKNRKAR